MCAAISTHAIRPKSSNQQIPQAVNYNAKNTPKRKRRASQTTKELQDGASVRLIGSCSCRISKVERYPVPPEVSWK